MKLKRFIAMLTITLVGFCSAEEQSICSDKMLALTIKESGDYSVNIKLLNSDSQVIYEHNLMYEEHPSAKNKKFLIDFSTAVVKIKSFALNKFGRVISSKEIKDSNFSSEENQTLWYIVTLTNRENETITSYINQCDSIVNEEQSEFFHNFKLSFLQDYESFQLKNMEILKEALDKNRKKELAKRSLVLKMHSLGYKRDFFGKTVPVNRTNKVRTPKLTIHGLRSE